GGAGAYPRPARDQKDRGWKDNGRDRRTVFFPRVFHGHHSLHGDPPLRHQRDELRAGRGDDSYRGSPRLVTPSVSVDARQGARRRGGVDSPVSHLGRIRVSTVRPPVGILDGWRRGWVGADLPST